MKNLLFIPILFLLGCNESVEFTPEDLAKGYNVCTTSNGGIKKIKMYKVTSDAEVKTLTFYCTNGVTYRYQIVPEHLRHKL